MNEKLTVEELVKALRCCASDGCNEECPCYADVGCMDGNMKQAADMLEELTKCKELSKLWSENQALKKQLATAQAENSKLAQQVPHWISVKDRLPKPEEEVIVSCVALCGYKQITTALYEDGTVNADESDWNWTDVDFDYDKKSGIYYIPKGWWEYKHYNPDDVYNNQIDDAVTHWMPLPEPPKEEKTDE